MHKMKADQLFSRLCILERSSPSVTLTDVGRLRQSCGTVHPPCCPKSVSFRAGRDRHFLANHVSLLTLGLSCCIFLPTLSCFFIDLANALLFRIVQSQLTYAHARYNHHLLMYSQPVRIPARVARKPCPDLKSKIDEPYPANVMTRLEIYKPNISFRNSYFVLPICLFEFPS
jgi:hypothetical protein